MFSLALTFPGSAGADDIAPCSPPRGVIVTSLEHGTPKAVLQALRQQVGDIVPPGGAFDATDVVLYRRNRRLIFIWNLGSRWVVATERGGIAYNDPVFAFDVGAEGRSAILIKQQDATPNTVCSTASGLIGAPQPTSRQQ